MCLFVEPWMGQCEEPGDPCCAKHSQEKCQVCGEQATTRCQASRGLMCGVPLCELCGAGEMCLHHAGSGPRMVIKALLGGGPEPTVFSTRDRLIKEADKMKEIVSNLKDVVHPTMDEFDEWAKKS